MTTMTFGKMKGRTFDDVLIDEGYTQWLMSTPSNFGNIKEFRAFAKLKGIDIKALENIILFRVFTTLSNKTTDLH